MGTMVDIWLDRMRLLGVKNTGALINSVNAVNLVADERYYSVELSHTFLEYGLWQDMGTGREIPHGNPGNVKVRDKAYRKANGLDKPRKRGPKWGGGETSGKMREVRRWMSPKYFASTLHIRDFMGRSLGEEFRYIFSDALRSDRLRNNSAHYRRNGY